MQFSGRVPAYHVQSPEFKPHYYKKDLHYDRPIKQYTREITAYPCLLQLSS
jgi:hypothetical protein